MPQRKKPSPATKEDPDYVLAYSTDPFPSKRCGQCLRAAADCICPRAQGAAPTNKPAAARIEKKGRGGKSVTVIYKLPPNGGYLEALCKFLKSSMGTGGTHYLSAGEGVIEIQGEREQEALELVKRFNSKQKR
jgi:translation initiation factor 1